MPRRGCRAARGTPCEAASRSALPLGITRALLAAVRILIVSTFRNEGPYLLEWLAHYRAAGATDFLLFSNDCSDGTDEMLARLDAEGIVHHLPNPREGSASVQWQALRRAWKHPLRKAADWALVCDADEFVNIHVPGHGFADLLAALPPEADALALPWRLFGHSGQLGILDAPVTRSFTHAISPEAEFPVAATLCKTLFRPSGPFTAFGVHRPRQRPEGKGRRPVFAGGGGGLLPEPFPALPNRISLMGLGGGRALAEMNHYAVRSAAAFLLKRARGLPNRERQVDHRHQSSRWKAQFSNTVRGPLHRRHGPEPRRTGAAQGACRPWPTARRRRSKQPPGERSRSWCETPEGQALFPQQILVSWGQRRRWPPHLQRKLTAMVSGSNKEHRARGKGDG